LEFSIWCFGFWLLARCGLGLRSVFSATVVFGLFGLGRLLKTHYFPLVASSVRHDLKASPGAAGKFSLALGGSSCRLILHIGGGAAFCFRLDAKDRPPPHARMRIKRKGVRQRGCERHGQRCAWAAEGWTLGRLALTLGLGRAQLLHPPCQIGGPPPGGPGPELDLPGEIPGVDEAVDRDPRERRVRAQTSCIVRSWSVIG